MGRGVMCAIVYARHTYVITIIYVLYTHDVNV